MKTKNIILKELKSSLLFWKTDIGILRNGLCDILCFSDNCVLKDEGLLCDDSEEVNTIFGTNYVEVG